MRYFGVRIYPEEPMRPITFLLFAYACATSLSALSQEKSQPLELRGIINLPQSKVALITQNRRSLQLRENERDGALEVMSIDPVLASVRVRLNSTNDIEIRLNKPDNTAPGNLMLDKPDLPEVLEIYAAASRRTILRGAALPNVQLTLYTNATSQSEIATILESALLEKGITVIPKGEHFAVFVPTSSAARLKLPEPPPPAEDNKSGEQLPAGVITFKNVDLAQAAIILAELKGQKLDKESVRRVPAPVISLRTMTTLSKAEAIYAMESVFLLNGIRVVQTGNDSFKFEPAGG